MKKKLVKQKRRLFLFIASSLLVLSLVVFSAFAVITFNSEKELLTMDAYSRFDFDTDQIAGNITTESTKKSIEYTITNQVGDNKNIQVILTDDNDNILGQTHNAITVNFYGEGWGNFGVPGIIDYDNFRKSMTDEQYNKITEYLTQDKTEDGKYYVLAGWEYYVPGRKIVEIDLGDGYSSKSITTSKDYIIPKTVDILLTEDSHTWYVQDEFIERFELNPVVDGDFDLDTAGEMTRNTIDTDFVLDKLEKEDIIGEISSQLQEENEDDEDDSYDEYTLRRKFDISNPDDYYENIYSVSPFTYVFYNEYFFVRYPDTIESVDDENNTNTYVYGNPDTSREVTYCIKYAIRFNVLESCMDRLVLMFIYIFSVFIIIGVIIGAVTWRTLRKQIIQEHQLRTITNSMAHELKTPLFVIGGYAENLIENINTEKKTHYANVILEKSESMNSLVSRMLDYSKLDWAGMKLHTEQFNLTEMTEKIIENYIVEAITLECDSDIFINADKRLIKSAVENLIDNAVKYSTVHGEIKVTISDGILTVSNPCDSLSKSEIDDMWQPYHRQAEQSSKPGHGLGLAIVKSIFNLHKFKYGATYANGCIYFWFRF